MFFNSKINLGNRLIGRDEKSYIIAEIGINFNGNLEIAKRTIDAAAKCGVDAVKFQTFDVDEFISDKSLLYTYSLQSGKKITETQYQMFKRLQLPLEWHFVLKKYANQKNLDFLSSGADKKSMDFLMQLGVPFLKIASEDIINVELIEYVAKYSIPIILSTGMADFKEIKNAIRIFKENHHRNLILLHCISAYPTPLNECNLRRIKKLRDMFEILVGFSDHTEGSNAAMLSIAAGACIVEKHFTLDHSLEGPDHSMSADPSQMKNLVKRVRFAEMILGNIDMEFSSVEKKSRDEFRRSIVAKVDMKKGEKITLDKIAYKRPGIGLKPYQREMILDKIINKDIYRNKMILKEDVDE